MKTRIYIVDDHALFRKGLAVLVNAEPDMEVCGEGEDCAVATQEILKLKPAVVVVDITLRGNNGIELIKNVKAVDPKIQFVVLSMHDIEEYSLPEVAQILEVPIGTLKSRLHRARARLRELLTEERSVRSERV